MKKATIFYLIMIIAFVFAVESIQAQNMTDLNGTWLFRNIPGQTCTIIQTGRNLRVITEKGAEGTGSFQNNSSIIVDMPFAKGITGAIINNGNRIRWSNGEFWERSNTFPNLTGRWLFRNINGQVCTITQTNNGLRLVTEKGKVGTAKFQNSTSITADFPFAKALTGMITNDATRIDWSNGEFWERSGIMPDLNGTWLFRNITGQICIIRQTGNNLTVITEKDVTGTGRFLNRTTISIDMPFAKGI